MTGLSVRGLTCRYRTRTVLDRLTLPGLAPGQVVGLIGPNAVGKSTLLRSIAGLQPARGQVTLGGADLQGLSPVARGRLVAYLPQALPQASGLVAYEALYSACRAVRGDLARPAIEAAIEETLDRLDLRDLALRRLSEMSGGQRQMVGLAQLMVRRPRLMLLDEPTSALDLRRQIVLIETLRRLAAAEGVICVIAIHDVNLALRFCDIVLALGPDGLAAAGPPAEMMSPDLLARVYGVAGRVETCSLGHPAVLVDRALPDIHRGNAR